MEDNEIISLYFDRDEKAIRETDKKYGKYCRKISLNILGKAQDAEECVNDAYFTVWGKIPPVRPTSFVGFLGRITRDISVSRLRYLRAEKRYSPGDVLLSELEECIPDAFDTETLSDGRELSLIINGWLSSLEKTDRVLFLRRYFYGDKVRQMAGIFGQTQNKISGRLYTLRKSLKEILEEEGYPIA